MADPEHDRIWEAIGNLSSLKAEVGVAVEVLRRVEEKVDKTNGSVAAIQTDHLRLEGAVSVLRQLVVFGVPAILATATIVVAIIGLVLR